MGMCVTGLRVEIDSGDGRCDVERNAVRFREDRDRVGADFVGDVAVGGDAVGADDHA